MRLFSFESVLLFLLLAAATIRLCRLIIEDQITEPLRERIWKRYPPATTLGYLLTCYWCTSIWIAAILVILYLLIPYVIIAISAILALSLLAGLYDEVRSR